MALYAMGDLHLSLNSNKSMEVFGSAWENYTERIHASLSRLKAEDVLVLAGDTSWGMTLEESTEDFRFLEQFPCQKYLIKGNHDYWWATAAKFRTFCEKNGFHTLSLLHNNCAFYGDHAICGSEDRRTLGAGNVGAGVGTDLAGDGVNTVAKLRGNCTCNRQRPLQCACWGACTIRRHDFSPALLKPPSNSAHSSSYCGSCRSCR